MRMTVKNIINSEAYNQQAEAWSKTHIFIAFAVAACVALFTELSIGWHWIWIAPTILFMSSLLIAMPTMIINVWLASILSPHMNYEIDGTLSFKNKKAKLIKFAKDAWSIIALLINGTIIYKLLYLIGN